MKKIVIIIVIAVALIGALVTFYLVFKSNFKKMQQDVEANARMIRDIDLSQIEDGTYKGHFESFLVAVTLEVVVKDHTIEAVNIIDQQSGKGYEGRAVIDRILEDQSLTVDARTGATGSSNAIRIAAYRALSEE